jgi:hypothetical protein
MWSLVRLIKYNQVKLAKCHVWAMILQSIEEACVRDIAGRVFTLQRTQVHVKCRNSGTGGVAQAAYMQESLKD